MTARASRLLIMVLWLLTVLLAARFVWQSLGVATRRSDGFAAYYTAARLVRSGAAGPRMYDDAWFNRQVDHFVPGVQDIYSPNPPTAALLLLPLSETRYAAARAIWMLLTVATLAVTLALIVHELRMRRPYALIFVSVAMASQPLQANMRQGQAYVLLFALATLVWIGTRRNNGRLAGASLGLMLAVKTAGVALPILLIVRRRWSALAWTALGGIAISAVSFVWFGLDSWRIYLRSLTRIRHEPDLSVTAYQTTNSLFRHLFIFDATWNRAPLFDAPLLATVAALGVSLALLAATVAFVARSDEIDLAFAALLALTILLSPLSLDYHFTLMLLPLAIVMTRLQDSDDGRAWAVLAVAAFLVAADLPYTSPRLGGGWALLAYPKLAGTVFVWGVSLWLLRRTGSASASARVPVAPMVESALGTDRYARG